LTFPTIRVEQVMCVDMHTYIWKGVRVYRTQEVLRKYDVSAGSSSNTSSDAVALRGVV
jgi:hypothetical protein